jgi:predicted methyltransferase
VGNNDNTEDFVPLFVRPLKDRKLLSVIQDSEAYDILSNRDNKQIEGNANYTGTSTKQPVVTKKSGNEKQQENSNKEKVLQEEIDKLRKEVTRWQTVNNKLMLKLKKVSSS